jgi:hypothetical protein
MKMIVNKAPTTQEPEVLEDLFETEHEDYTQGDTRSRKQPRLLRKAQKLQQERLSAYKYFYNVLGNAVDRLLDQSTDILTADENDMLWLASMNPKEVKAFSARLRKLKLLVDDTAKEIMGSNKSTWFRTHYDPTRLETCLPPW